MDMQQLISILKARRKILAAIAGGFILAGLVISLLWPKSYEADVSVVVDAKNTDPVTGVMLAGDMMPNFAATQIDIINSHNVAKKVVIALKLQTESTWQQAFKDADISDGRIDDWIADRILTHLKVIPSRDSKVMVIAYSDHDPITAANFANAFAEAYIQTALEIKLDPARRQAAWYDKQLTSLRNRLEKAKQDLSDFQRKHNLISSQEHLDVENQHLTELSQQYVNLQAANYDAQSRVHQLNQAMNTHRVEELADILGNPLLQSMKADLVRAQAKLANIAALYDRNHPKYISAAAEVATLKSKLASETNTVKGSILEAAQLAKQRVEDMHQAVEKQKQKILAMNQEKDTQDFLEREVANAQQSYDLAVQRASQLGLESRLDQSNIAILNPGQPPLQAKWPKPILNIVLSAILGTIMGLLAVLLLEFRDRRIRCRKDIETLLDLPVLGSFKTALP